MYAPSRGSRPPAGGRAGDDHAPGVKVRAEGDPSFNPADTLDRSARDQLVASLWREGRSHAEIASAARVSGWTVRDTLCRLRTAGESLPHRNRRWSGADEAALIEGLRTGASYADLADLLGRSVGALHVRVGLIRRRGVDVPLLRRDWSTDDDARVAASASSSDGLARLADAMGCTVAVVEARLRKLQMREAASRRELAAAWTPDSDDRIRHGYLAGATLAELARTVGRSLHAVQTRINQLAATSPELAPRKPRWTDAERQRLARRYREGASLSQLEREFGKTRGTITSQLRTCRRLGMNLTRAG